MDNPLYSYVVLLLINGLYKIIYQDLSIQTDCKQFNIIKLTYFIQYSIMMRILFVCS